MRSTIFRMLIITFAILVFAERLGVTDLFPAKTDKAIMAGLMSAFFLVTLLAFVFHKDVLGLGLVPNSSARTRVRTSEERIVRRRCFLSGRFIQQKRTYLYILRVTLSDKRLRVAFVISRPGAALLDVPTHEIACVKEVLPPWHPTRVDALRLKCLPETKWSDFELYVDNASLWLADFADLGVPAISLNDDNEQAREE
ncbi:MAG TPA: hypothetical protein PLD73_03835 [Candidatus Hydrogenedentes bacterium]|nr:hypothetical protein [Candidatus Hydrogenedentota bacterium]